MLVFLDFALVLFQSVVEDPGYHCANSLDQDGEPSMKFCIMKKFTDGQQHDDVENHECLSPFREFLDSVANGMHGDHVHV